MADGDFVPELYHLDRCRQSGQWRWLLSATLVGQGDESLEMGDAGTAIGRHLQPAILWRMIEVLDR
jgi:hypothetical protein